MYCENEKGRRVDLSSKEYRSCVGGKCGGWKWVQPGCPPHSGSCGGKSGAWLPAAEICRLNLYAKFEKVIKPSGFFSSSSSSSQSSSSSFSSSSSIPAPSRAIRSADYVCPNSCPTGCCDEAGWVCCPDGLYCAATPGDCPASTLGMLAVTSKPLFDPTACEGTECPAGCCPGENWFCCPDNIYCASTAADCPSASADITGEPTTIAGVAFDPSDYFDTSKLPMRFVSGATAGEFVIPEWLGFNRAVYVNAQGGITDEYVAPRQIVRFRSTIVLGYDPEGSQDSGLPQPPSFAVESVGNQETGAVYNVTVDPVEGATGYVFRFEGTAIRPDRIGPAPATPDGYPEISEGQYQYLTELDGYAMTVASTNQNGTGVFSDFVRVGYRKCRYGGECEPCERCVVNGDRPAFMEPLSILCEEDGRCHCASRCVGEEVCCDGNCEDFCCETNSDCESNLCEICFKGECITRCGADQMCCDGECKETCCSENKDCGPCEECRGGRCQNIPGYVFCGGRCVSGLSCCETNLNCGPCQKCGLDGSCISICDEENKYCCYGTCRSTKCCVDDSECGDCEICNTGGLGALRAYAPINTCIYICDDDQCCKNGGCQSLPCCSGNGDCDASKCEICFNGECVPDCGLNQVCCDGTCKEPPCSMKWICNGGMCSSTPSEYGTYDSEEQCESWCVDGSWCVLDPNTSEGTGGCLSGNKEAWKAARLEAEAGDFQQGKSCKDAGCISGDCYREWLARVDCETNSWTINPEGSVYCGESPEEGTDSWNAATSCVYVYSMKLGPCGSLEACEKYKTDPSISPPGPPSFEPPKRCCCKTDEDCGCAYGNATYYPELAEIRPGEGCCMDGAYFDPAVGYCWSGYVGSESNAVQSYFCCDGKCQENPCKQTSDSSP